MLSPWRVRNLAHPLIVLAAAFGAACAPTDTSSPTGSVSQLIDSTDFARGSGRGAGAVTTANVRVTLARPVVYGAGVVSGVTAEALDVNGQPLSGKVISWTTSNQNIAKMYSTKLVQSVARSGKVDVIATIDGVKGSAVFTVIDSAITQYVSAVAVSLPAPALQTGQTTQAAATMYDEGGKLVTGRLATWTSSNPAVATVSSTGLVSAVAAGSANIVAAVDGRSGQTALTVSGAIAVPVASVSVSLDSSSLIIGGTTQARASMFDASNAALTGRAVTWSTNNPAVATVSNSGVVTAVGAGIANIIATSEGKTGQATLNVGLVPVASVQVTLNPGFVFTGQGAQATAVARDANNNILTGRLVTWSSSATSVATVASSGAVTSVAPGTTNISAVIDGKQGAAMLTVSKVPVASVTVSLASTSIAPAATSQASAVTKDSAGVVLTGRAIAWTSSNTAVATVNASTGLVTAVAVGTANIIATSEGKTGLAAVTVATVTAAPVATVMITVAPVAMNVGQTSQSTVVVRDASNNTLTGRSIVVHSGDPSIATVSSTGVVTGVTAGTAWIIANSEGKTGSVQVTVMAGSGGGGTTPSASVATVTVSLTAASLTAGQNSTASAVLKDSANNVLTGRTIAWSSSNTATATVNASTGVVTAVAVGSANIIATSGGKTGQAAVTVSAIPVATVSASLASASLTAGQTTQATAVARDASNNIMSGVAATWSSSNTAVATVNSAGLVTAVAAGSANIVATAQGKSGQATLTVAAPPTGGGGGSGGTSALSGSVRDNGVAIGGGSVEILSGTTVVQTVAVQSNGTFSVPTIAAGTYDVRLHPALKYSLGATEPQTRQVSITSGTPASVSFTVQQAMYADDFQSYTSSSQINSGSMTTGNFWAAASHDIGAVSNPAAISLDPTGGLNGGKAMRYDWPARPTAACTGAEITIGIMPRLNPPPVATKDLWVRFTSRESPNFEHGRTGCGGRSYKFFLVQFESGYYGKQGRIGTYLGDASSASMMPTNLWMDMNDNQGSQNMNGALPIGGNVSWGGAWHTWVMGLEGIGTSAATYTVYMDGKKINSMTAPFLAGQSVGPGWAVTFEMGANMNNGPDNAQSRWFREFGVYSTRPSLVP